ncbi:putative WD40/YVTN repeat-like-containing domain superfamily, WD40-repeat-containing [Plasmopara halstedii]
MDQEDVEIRPTDSVILVANTEDDFSNLEVQVYDDENGPVNGSFVAVGTFKPGIEIWDLDVLDMLLYNEISAEKKQKTVLKPGSHQDAVMSLDWNSSHRNMLASGSADSTVKVWDITTQKCLYTMTHHNNKVQSVRWNMAETTVLASASFDRTIVVLDGHGVVVGFDVRMNGSNPLFRLDAHTGALWDLQSNAPVCVASKEMNVVRKFVSAVHTRKGDSRLTRMFYVMQVSYLLCHFTRIHHFCSELAGQRYFALWDTSENEAVERLFSSRVHGIQRLRLAVSRHLFNRLISLAKS